MEVEGKNQRGNLEKKDPILTQHPNEIKESNIDIDINENWQIIKELSYGSFGLVYLANDIKNDQNLVCLKCAYNSNRSSKFHFEQIIEMYQNEARIINMITAHPNVIKLLGYYPNATWKSESINTNNINNNDDNNNNIDLQNNSNDDHRQGQEKIEEEKTILEREEKEIVKIKVKLPSKDQDQDQDQDKAPFRMKKFGIVLVLEYAENSDLFHNISNYGAMTEIVARTYFHQLIDVLEFMHRKRLIHCDLKPENLVFDSEYIIKLIDFGFSKCLNDSEEENKSLRTSGTEEYFAPELFNLDLLTRYASSKTFGRDIWSLGIVIFVMVIAHKPWHVDHYIRFYMKGGGQHWNPKDKQEAWYYRKWFDGQYDVFWNGHKLFSRDPSPEFRRLFEGMMTIDPKKRWTIADIKMSEWYNQEILTPEELKIAMQKRCKKQSVMN